MGKKGNGRGQMGGSCSSWGSGSLVDQQIPCYLAPDASNSVIMYVCARVSSASACEFVGVSIHVCGCVDISLCVHSSMAACINVSMCVSPWMGGASADSVHRGKRSVREKGQEQATREWMLSRGWEHHGGQKKSGSS